MKTFYKKMLSLRFPVAVLVLLITLGFTYTVFAVTLDSAMFAPVGSDDGFNITFSVTFEGNVENKSQTLTFFGETFDSDGTNSATDLTWTAGQNYSTVRHYSGDVTRCMVDVKSSADVMFKATADFKVLNSDTTGYTSTYCPNYNDVVNGSQVNNHSYAVITNPQQKDLLVQLHYSNTEAVVDGYGVTVIPKGDYGPYVDENSNAQYQGTYFYRYHSSLDTTTRKPGTSYTYLSFDYTPNYFAKTVFYKSEAGDYGLNPKFSFDRSYLSNISDIIMYYSDDDTKTNLLTNDETEMFKSYSSFSDLVRPGEQQIDLSSRYVAGRNFTFEVTYQRNNYRNIYSNITLLNNNTNNRTISLSTGSSSDKYFLSNGGAPAYTANLYENKFNADYGPALLEDADSITFTMNYDNFDLLDSANFACYKRNADGSKGAQLNCTLTQARTNVGGSKGFIYTLSGIRNQGDILLEAELYHPEVNTRLVNDGLHPGKLDVLSADTNVSPNPTNATNITAAYKTLDDNFFTGGTYKILYSDPALTSKISSIDYTYVTNDNVTHTVTVDSDGTSTDSTVLWKVNDGEYRVAVPMMLNSNANPNTGNTYEKMITVHYADLAPADGYYRYTTEFEESGRGSVVVAGTATANHPATDAPVITSEQSAGGTTSTYNANLELTGTYDLSSDKAYYLRAGKKYKISDKYTRYRNQRLELLSFTVYEIDSTGEVKTDGEGNPVTVTLTDIATQSGAARSWEFTMPQSNIKVVPVYKDHLHSIKVQYNTARGSYSLTSDKTPVGTSSVNSFYSFNSSSYYTYDGNTSANYSTSYYTINDGRTLTLTATPNGSYEVIDVKAYVSDENRVRTPGEMTDLTVNDDGSVADGYTEVQNLVFTPVEGEENKYTILLPGGVGNDQTNEISTKSFIIYINFGTSANFAPVKFTLDTPLSTDSLIPAVQLWGDIKDNSNGYVQAVTQGNSSKLTTGDNVEADVDTPLTVKMGIKASTNKEPTAYKNSKFVYSNFVYTVNNATTDEFLFSFKYYLGNSRSGETEDSHTTFISGNETLYNTIMTQKPVAEYGYSSSASSPDYAEMKQAVTTTFVMALPEYGLDIHMSVADTYTPIVVNQYIIGSDGSVTPVTADDGFSVYIEKYANTTNTDAYRQKFFTKTYPANYDTLTGDSDNFESNYTVTSPSETRWMLTESQYTGAYVKPSPKSGYMLSGVKALALNRDGTVVDNSESGYSNARAMQLTSSYDANAAKLCYRFYQYGSSYTNCYSRSQQMQINVYYAEDSSLTVYQHTTSQTDQTNTSSQLEKITVTAYDTPASSELSNPFILSGRMYDALSLTTYGKHVTLSNGSSTNYNSVKEDDTYKWTASTGINQGYKLQFSVETKGSNRIKSASAYLSDGTELTLTRTSGNGHAGTTTVYQIAEAVTCGDDITFDIEYEKEQYLTVEVKELSDSNALIDNRVDYTKGTVTVTGATTDGTNILPFYDAEDNRSDSFNVETTHTTLAEYNTRVTVTTNFASNNGYVVANVYAYNLDTSGSPTGSPLELRPIVVDSSISETEAYNYKQCVLNGLTPDTNVKITVILAKTCDLRVAVHTANDAGIYGDGLKTGDPSSYVNFSASNSKIAKTASDAKAIVTAYSEGNYNTSEVTVHDNPYYRNVNVVQGSDVKGFVQLPLSGDYIVTKIVYKYISGGVTYIPDTDTSASNLYVFTDDLTGSKYLRYNFSAATNLDPNKEKYFVDVYVAPAKSIYSRLTLEDGNASSGTQCGSVYINGVNNVDTQVTKPFTQIVPQPTGTASSNLLSNSYNAFNNTNSDNYLKQVKCVRDTEITLDITPKTNQIISQVNVTLGSWDGPAVELEAGEPDANTRAVRYTLKQGEDNFRMPALNDLYVHVVFAPDFNSTVKLDLQYTDDFTSWKPLTDLSDTYNLTITGSNSSHLYNNVSYLKNKTTNNTDNSQTITDISHEYDVKAGTLIKVKVQKAENNTTPWYFVTDRWVSYETSGTDVPDPVSRGGNINTTELSKTINSNQTAVFHMRFVPVSKIHFSVTNNNLYHSSNSTDDVVGSTSSDETICNLVASNPHVDEYAPAAMFRYEGGSPVWRNDDNDPGSELMIVKDSSIVFSVNDSAILPGYHYSLKLYEDGVEVPGAFEKDTAASGDQGNGKVMSFYNLQGVTDPDHNYHIEFTYDRTEFLSYVDGASTNIYMVYTDSNVTDGSDINVYDSTTYNKKVKVRNTGHSRGHDEKLDESWSNIGGNTFVIIEAFAPNTEIYIGSKDDDAYWQDYADYTTNANGSTTITKHDIRTQLRNSYFTKKVGGYTRYFYWYQLNPNDEYSFNNTHYLHVIFRRDKNTPVVEPKVEPATPATINLAQFKRDDRNEIVDANEATDGTVVMRNKSGTKLLYGSDEVDSVSLPQITSGNTGISSLTCTSYVKEYLTLTVTPAANQIVTRVEVIDLSGYTYLLSPKSKSNGVYTYEHQVNKTFYNINIYYSEPRVTVSFNNENNASNQVARGTVYVDSVDGSAFIGNTQFMNGFYTDRGTYRQLIIVPETYVNSAGETKYYELDAILYGDARDNMTAIDPALYSLSEETGVITVYLNDIQSDIDVDIRLRRENDPKTARLIVSHYIMMGDGYQLCDELSHGEVIVTALNHDKTEAVQLIDNENANVDSLSLTTEGTIMGAAYEDSYLYFNVTPPENFKISEVRGRYASTDAENQYSESLIFTKSDGAGGSTDYALTSDSPDSGVVYVDVYYDLYRYNLDFTYTDRYGAEKSYKATGSLTIQEAQSFMNEEGEIELSEEFIMSKAPYESNHAKDFRWGGDEDEKITRGVDSNGNPTAVIEDIQTQKPVVINYKTTDDEEAPYQRVSVPYGEIVKLDNENPTLYNKNGSYITADEKGVEGGEFSYWKIEKKAENGGEGMQEIARCYYPDFNYAALGSYTITPVYEGEKPFTGDGTSTSLSLLEYNRNQWTDEGGVKTGATDRLYADFEVSFRDNGKLINSEDWKEGNPYTCGVVFEVCGKLSEEQAQNFSANIAGVSYDTDIASLKEAIKESQSKCGDRTLIYNVIDKSKLTNKNRLELFQGFGNTTKTNDETGEEELNNALFVIKAYSYMMKEGSEDVILSNPVYINLYDVATTEYNYNG